jgi:hypothetical protein
MGGKAQLIMQDLGGARNADLHGSTAKIIKGASWKKQRIVLILPAGEAIPAKVALSHWNMVFPPNQGVVRVLAQGMEVGEAYSSAIEQVLAHPELSQWEYILTIEHDNMPPSDGVLKLLEQMEAHPEFACIGGLYWTKGYGGVPQIWGDPKDPVLNFRPLPPDTNGGLVECCGTGMGFNLWRLSMFKDERLRRPWFETVASAAGVGSQDLYFWGDARKYGYRCAVDCSVKVGHYDFDGKYGPPDFVW